MNLRFRVSFRVAVAIMTLWFIGFGSSDTNTAAPISQASKLSRLKDAVTPMIALERGQSSAQRKGVLAEDVFKNVQTLKGTSVDDFMATMGLMAAALGFDCDSCHERAGTDYVAWERDTPNKIVARRMVLMVQSINRDNFKGRQMVTCFTCHRNRDVPLVTPNLDDWYGEPIQTLDDVLPSAPGGTRADQILARYIQAIGGAQKVSALTSFVATGEGSGFGAFGGKAKVEILAQTPDRRATYITFPTDANRGASIRTFDGLTGWIATPLAVVRKYEVSGSELDGAKLDAELSFPAQVAKVLQNLHAAGESSLKGKDVELVQGTSPRGTIVTLFVDKSSGLLMRILRYGRSPIGRLPTQIDYDDYKDVSGVKFPFRLTFSWLDGRDTFEIKNVAVNVQIDSKRFGEPNP